MDKVPTTWYYFETLVGGDTCVEELESFGILFVLRTLTKILFECTYLITNAWCDALNYFIRIRNVIYL